ncbi:aminofutalosine synthase MqnE [Kyrpidia spormannii]|uniref:Aminodeoxyfutalosine synthase n=1 Tax=Kyrpidia spormannii TaxID=2055160 RepID=A0A2K8N6Z4_9BACL|nr:aminofutalosine synthase MqnE [Kyrpidia spormannii]ATY84222.1 aminofutalosine synthase MqnE [Kyrpidia spormannii]
MFSTSTHPALAAVERKFAAGERLDFEDGLALLQSPDLLRVGAMADEVRRQKNGDDAYFIINTHLNYTNICHLSCKLCAFGIKPDQPGAYALSLEQLEAKMKEIAGRGFTELHIVGGVNASLPLSYYEEMMRLAKRILPGVHVQAFTAVEIDYMARIAKLPVETVLERLREAGLDSILGGGAEVFDPEVRRIIAGHKTSADRWFAVHRAAHQMGIRTNASILYGHIERPEHVVDHLLRLRELQDETGGFSCFFPFAFHPANTALAEEYGIQDTTSGYHDLRILATARLLLDNFDHIRAFWMMIGEKMAQVSLAFGVDDLDGTVMEEQIVHAAGAETAQMAPKEQFIRLIREAGRIPVQRDTLYNKLKIY